MNNLKYMFIPARLASALGAIVVFASLCACDPGKSEKDEYVIPYDIDNPQEFELIPELKEISGIVPTVDGQALWAINDENGKLYKLDFTGKVISAKWFSKGGDYEDVAMVDSMVYVMKSNGNLYRIDTPNGDSLSATPFKLKLERVVEFESLAADLDNDRLLLLVKDGEGSKGKAPVYGFNLSKHTYEPDHVLLVDPTYSTRVAVKGKNLRASAMAIHPITGHIYIVTSIQRLLLVCDKEGNGIASFRLSKKRFPQPEGICFLPDGTLFISSEGIRKPAKLYKYDYQNRDTAVRDTVPQ